MENKRPYFLVEGQETEHKMYLNGEGPWTIGRSVKNVFAFEDHSMSRRQAVVQELQPGKFYFIDLGSRNGSTLNGRRVTTPVELHDGDSVGCADTCLVFHKRRQESEAGRLSSGVTTLRVLRRRLTTVLVVDIRDFTALSCQIEEDLLAQTIGTWFRELGSIFQRRGSVTEKYIGDAAMAVWLHERRLPDRKQIRSVLETLLEIRQFTANLQKQFSLPSAVRIGAGINIGISAIGNSGPQDNPDFSPLGECVNAAFRLEGSTKDSGFDVALGGLAFDCLDVGQNVVSPFEKRIVEMKGYDQPAAVYLTSYSSLRNFLDRTR